MDNHGAMERFVAGIPDTVMFERKPFINRQNIKLASYRWKRKDVKRTRGIVQMVHGYGSYLIFDYFPPAEPGAPHGIFKGSIIDVLLQEGFEVCGIDHQSLGYSDGVRANVRCFFEKYQDLVNEQVDFSDQVVNGPEENKHLPKFLIGLSMGGGTCVRISQERPDMFSGMVLFSPMLSLERVKQKSIFLCIKNKHLESIAKCVSWFMPTAPIGAPPTNVEFPLVQQEIENDPITYTDGVRSRTGEQFIAFADALDEKSSPTAFETVSVDFAVFHSPIDIFTDPEGSAKLICRAASKNKRLFEVGAGCEIDAPNMVHGLATENGHEKVTQAAVKWIIERITGLTTI